MHYGHPVVEAGDAATRPTPHGTDPTVENALVQTIASAFSFVSYPSALRYSPLFSGN